MYRDDRSVGFPIGLLVLGALVGGLALTATGYLTLREWERREAQTAFRHLTDAHLASFQRELDMNLDVALGLRDFLVAETSVSPQEFARYARPAVRRLPSLQALEWIPRVAREERRQYEAGTRPDGLPGPDLAITERAESGGLVPAADRDEYFPVYLVEPLAGNEAALGFDLASDPARRAAMEQARDGGTLRATGPITLVQDAQEHFGFLLLLPVHEEPAGAPGRLRGFAAGVYRIGDIFRSALDRSQLKPGRIALRVWDDQAPEGKRLVYDHLPALWRERSVDTLERGIQVAGRAWRVQAHPTPEFADEHRSRQSLTVLVVGVLLSLLLAKYLHGQQSLHAKIRRLVAQRTEELRASEYRTQVIVDTAVNAIITIDEGGLIRSFNPAAQRLFGYPAEAVIGRNVKLLMPEPYRAAHDGYLARYRAEGHPRIIGIGREVRAVRRDGTEFPVDLAVGEARVGGSSLFVGMIVDISLRKEAEQALVRAKEDAERSSRMKSEFVNMMSHELRTPLTVILGYLPLLKDPKRQPAPELIASIATDMKTSGDHLLSLINDLLDVSKIEAGKMHLRREVLSLDVAVGAAVESLRPAAEKKGLRLLAEAPPGRVDADPLRLRQVLINLIGNAIKFTDRGHVRVVAERLDGGALIRVEDTGCGIAPEHLGSVFEKFRQVDSSATRAAGGTGLGLTITERLIDLHGGRIHVDSVPGQGSQFIFSIPDSPETT